MKSSLPLFILSAILLSGCVKNEEDERDEPLCDDFSAVVRLKNSQGQETNAFGSGAPITFESRITNNATAPRSLTVKDACPQVTFIVVNAAGQAGWSSLDGVSCDQAQRTETYAAGETKTLSKIWDQRLRDNGAQAPSGNYVVEADDATQCKNKLSKTANFAIQ